MGKSTTFSNDLLKLILNATAIANMADNAASSPLSNLYLALHTADPGVAGVQNTSEVSNTGYARKAVARTTGGFTVTNNEAVLAANQDFPTITSGTAGSPTVATHWSLGIASSGATKILFKGVIGSRLGAFTGATNDVIKIPGLTGLAVGDRIAFEAVDGSSLPTGVTEGTVYWVISVSGDDITISTTSGGSAVDLTAVGDGVAFKVTPLLLYNGVTPQLTTATKIVEG